ncbi:MAG: c-type cytochrome [Myxococcales bacterium]|nr:c-type cytochrome [Myxococcales bacterium]
MLRPRSGRSRLLAAHGRRRHAPSPIGGLPILAAFALAVGLTGCKEPTGPEREISGARLFSQNCARCHGADGKGAADAPAGTRDLTDPGHMSMLTDQQIKRVIQMGKPPNMPAFGRQFAEPSIKVLVAFVRDLSAPRPPAGAAEGDAP